MNNDQILVMFLLIFAFYIGFLLGMSFNQAISKRIDDAG